MTCNFLKSDFFFFIQKFILLSRLPFHTVGIFPFILGTVLAMYDGYFIRLDVLLFGILGTFFIMLATYLAGEYYDQDEDSEVISECKSRFSGGAQVIQQGFIRPSMVWLASLTALISAGCIGLYIWLGLETGPFTLPLGILGMIGGFLYSAKPVRWVSRGLGELWIAFCYGWLPIAAAYYLQTQTISYTLTFISVPIICSIVAVILINEFADYEADEKWGKRNLLVRTGMDTGIKVYLIFILTAIISALILAEWKFGSIVIMVPVFFLGFVLCSMAVRNWWKDFDRREWMCGGTILLNLSITLTWIIGFLW
ncbi:MAG: prenyltransferase [Methanomicrobiales archaeon]|nr:prenyltransferase [Methanomicrobiales archaeon]